MVCPQLRGDSIKGEATVDGQRLDEPTYFKGMAEQILPLMTAPPSESSSSGSDRCVRDACLGECKGI